MTAVKSRTLPLSQRPIRHFESFMWIFTRFTVLAMYGLLLLGFIGALIVRAQTGANLADVFVWAFLPASIANPLTGPTWWVILARLMVAGFLMVLWGHGIHGMIVILDDYVKDLVWHRRYRNVILAGVAVVLVLSILIIWAA